MGSGGAGRFRAELELGANAEALLKALGSVNTALEATLKATVKLHDALSKFGAADSLKAADKAADSLATKVEKVVKGLKEGQLDKVAEPLKQEFIAADKALIGLTARIRAFPNSAKEMAGLGAGRSIESLIRATTGRNQVAQYLEVAQQEAVELGIVIRERALKALKDLQAQQAAKPSVLAPDARGGRIFQGQEASAGVTKLEEQLLKAALAGQRSDQVLKQITESIKKLQAEASGLAKAGLDSPVPLERIREIDGQLKRLGAVGETQFEKIGKAAIGALSKLNFSGVTAQMQQLQGAATKTSQVLSTFGANQFFAGLVKQGQAVQAVLQSLDFSKILPVTDAMVKSLSSIRAAAASAVANLDPRDATGKLKALLQILNDTGRGATKTAKDIEHMQRKLQGGGSAFERFFAPVRRAKESLDNFGLALNKIGLAESDLAILLGAGLAGGLAGVIRIIQKFVTEIAQAVGELERFNKDIDRSFKESAESVRQWSQDTASSFGLSATEALKAAVAFREVAVVLRVNEEAQAAFSQGLASASGVFEEIVPGIHKTEDAQKLLAEAVKGSDEAMRKLEITIGDLNRAARETFNTQFFGQLSEFEQPIARFNAVLTKAQEHIRESGRVSTSATDSIRDLGRSFDQLFSEEDNKKFKAALAILEDFSLGANVAGGAAAGALAGLTQGAVPAGALDDVAQLKREIHGLGEAQLLLLRARIEESDNSEKEKRVAIGLIDDELAAIEKVVAAIEDQKKKVQDTEQARAAALKDFLNNVDKQRQGFDAVRAAQEAQEDGTRRVEQAERQLHRTRIDNGRRYQEVLRENQRAAEDAARQVEDAEIDLEETRSDFQDRREDAADRLADARRDALRTDRDFKERIEDLEREHQRKVEDAVKDAEEAKKEAAFSTLEAEISVAEARRKHDQEAENQARRELSRIGRQGTEEATTAQEKLDLAREQEDFEREIARLRRDRDEARLDSDEEIRRAIRETARVERDATREIYQAQLQVNDAKRDQVRATEDAIKALEDYEIESKRAVADAKRAVREAQIARDRAIASANRQLRRTAEILGVQLQTLVDIYNQALLLEQWFPGAHSYAPALGTGEGRAHGGPVTARMPYLVGERGPELFVPNRSGNIVSNKDLYALLDLLKKQFLHTGFTKGSQTFIVNESVNPYATASAISARLAMDVIR